MNVSLKVWGITYIRRKLEDSWKELRSKFDIKFGENLKAE